METKFAIGDRVRLTEEFLLSVFKNADSYRDFFTGTIIRLVSGDVEIDFDGRGIITYSPCNVELAGAGPNGLETMLEISFG